MRPYVIVLFEPHVDDDLSLIDVREPFSIENFMAQGSIEALIVAILHPRLLHHLHHRLRV